MVIYSTIKVAIGVSRRHRRGILLFWIFLVFTPILFIWWVYTDENTSSIDRNILFGLGILLVIFLIIANPPVGFIAAVVGLLIYFASRNTDSDTDRQRESIDD